MVSWFSTINTQSLERIPTDDVKRKAANRMFISSEFKIYPEDLGKDIGVFQQPRSEHVCLMRPDLMWIDALKPLQLRY